MSMLPAFTLFPIIENKICGQNLQTGDKGSFQCHTYASNPPPPAPLRLDIDT